MLAPLLRMFYHRKELQYHDVLFNTSAGNASAHGRWAHGPSLDGEGEFTYVERPVPFAGKPTLKPAPPNVYNTPPMDGK